ncbi:hypothetical protein [Sporosarcina sp. FSL W7-1283]|uniref:hypothetical protein n=1 Tax=Sporosarcina sp. FSL W7-1283 TaxID=2921560 RepID=UPI0030FA1D48
MRNFHFIVKWVAGITGDKSNYDFESILIVETENVTDAVKKLFEWAKNEKVTIIEYKQMDRPFYI